MPASPHAALIAANLTPTEAAVWAHLSTHGPDHVMGISRAIHKHRPGVYDALKNLQRQSLVAASKGPGRVTYKAVGAALLAKRRETNEKVLADQLKHASKQEQAATEADIVRIYHGKALKRVWEEIAKLPKNTVFYRYDGYQPTTNLEPYIPDSYKAAIQNRQLERFVITNQALRKAPFKKRIECASRVLPGANAFNQGVTQFAFCDTIALVDFSTETAILIKNKALAGYQIQLFKHLFDRLEA